MFYHITLLFIVPVLANCHGHVDLDEHVYRDGACPTPPKAQENFNAEDLNGVWRVVSSGEEKFQPKSCFEANVTQLEKGSFTMDMQYTDDKSKTKYYWVRRYTPIAGKPGHFNFELKQVKPKSEDDFTRTKWKHTIVKYDKDSYRLAYACQEVDGKHADYYRAYARKIDEEAKKGIAAAYKETGEKRPLHDFNNDDCKWEWN